nr:DUF459 domain-containing protein [Euzebyales bacterium]
SLSSELSSALADLAARSGPAKTTVDFRYSTGLARPDFFDWPAELKRVAVDLDPDAFVVMFGANDGQDIAVNGEVFAFGSPAWEAEYRSRVDRVMDLLRRDGRSVVWVGQPVMRSAEFDARMDVLNAVYAAAAAGREAVTFVDTQKLFAGPGGGYAPYLPDASGRPVLMRQQDGIHLTLAGGERLATAVLAPLAQRWHLRVPPG